MSVRVVLADDCRFVRDRLRELLECEPDIEVIGEVEDGGAAVAAARRLRPDVVVMDLVMPHVNGIEATRQIAAAGTAVKVLALSMHADRRFVAGALKAGASGYVLKDCAGEELVEAVRAVAADRIYISPGLGVTAAAR